MYTENKTESLGTKNMNRFIVAQGFSKFERPFIRFLKCVLTNVDTQGKNTNCGVKSLLKSMT